MKPIGMVILGFCIGFIIILKVEVLVLNKKVTLLRQEVAVTKDIKAYHELLTRMSHIETKDHILTSNLNTVIARVDHLEQR